MAHEHHHHEVKGQRLFWTIILNLSISIAELVGGLISGSIALISDAIHNFSDVLSLVISYIANKLTHKSASEKHTFGYKRSEILAAFFNSATLLILAFFILYEAILRFLEHKQITPNLVIYLSIGSIVVNAISVLFIQKNAKDNINMKSAYLHLFSDMLTSIAVLIGGILMKYYQIYWIDPLLSSVIAIYLIYMSWGIFKYSLKIIMQFTPENINLKNIANEIEEINDIKNIHHIHIWQINEHDIMFEAHIDLEKNIKITDFEQIKKQIEMILKKYHIYHITLQPEFSVEDNKQIIH